MLVEAHCHALFALSENANFKGNNEMDLHSLSAKVLPDMNINPKMTNSNPILEFSSFDLKPADDKTCNSKYLRSIGI